MPIFALLFVLAAFWPRSALAQQDTWAPARGETRITATSVVHRLFWDRSMRLPESHALEVDTVIDSDRWPPLPDVPLASLRFGVHWNLVQNDLPCARPDTTLFDTNGTTLGVISFCPRDIVPGRWYRIEWAYEGRTADDVGMTAAHLSIQVSAPGLANPRGGCLLYTERTSGTGNCRISSPPAWCTGAYCNLCSQICRPDVATTFAVPMVADEAWHGCGATRRTDAVAQQCSPFQCPDREEDCRNGQDDDCDTRADCMDSDCASSPACVGCTATTCRDDGNRCNGSERCEAGACVSGPALACARDEFCDPPSGCQCIEGGTRDCYQGPSATLGVGRCRPGTRRCTVEGTWSACVGQVLPAASETCGNGVDDNCNNSVDEGCVPSADASVVDAGLPRDASMDAGSPDSGGAPCLAPRLLCGGVCVDPRTDLANCGACSRPCTLPNATATCAASECAVMACRAGFGNCDGNAANGCERDLTSDNAHCGGCGRPCGVGTVCSTSSCRSTCGPGLTPCPSGCADLRSDPRNCNVCGRACPAAPNATATCATATCGFSCSAGFGDCDRASGNGCETDLSTNSAHCGVCGRACTSAERCNGRGTCVCVPDCAGRNCGPDGCGGVCGTCSDGQVCTSGNCAPAGMPEQCNGLDDDRNGVIDDLDSCWRPVYRFWDESMPESRRSRCYANTPTPPSECAGYIRERDLRTGVVYGPVFYLHDRAITGTAELIPFDLSQDHILTRGDDADALRALRGVYRERAALGYLWTSTTPPPGRYHQPAGAATGNVRELRRYSSPPGIHLYANNPEETAPGWSFAASS